MVINEKETSTILIALDYFIKDIREFFLSGVCINEVSDVYLDVVRLHQKINEDKEE